MTFAQSKARSLLLITALLLGALLVASACGTGEPQPDDVVDVSGPDSDQVSGERTAQLAQSSTTTTRDICRACGCVDSFFNCRCGSRKRLQCVLGGGPKKVLGFAVTSRAAAR